MTKQTQLLEKEIEGLIKEKSITISKDFNIGLYVKAEHILALASKLGETDELMPKEVLDLVRFLASLYNDIDKCVYEHGDSDLLMKYPVVQGTANQLKLKRIGEQEYSNKTIHTGVEFMLSNSEES